MVHLEEDAELRNRICLLMTEAVCRLWLSCLLNSGVSAVGALLESV